MTHTKRHAAPRIYPLPRKRAHGTFVPESKGGHPSERSVPLTIVLRDMLGLAQTAAEARQILHENDVLHDGKRVRDLHTTVGFMDVLSFPALDEHYRFLITKNGVVLREIDAEEAEKKLCKVADKTMLKGGVTQINLHDGTNIQTETDCTTKGSILLSLPERDVTATIPFKTDVQACLIGGKHSGEIATITDIQTIEGSHPNIVTLENEKGTFETIEENIFVIGKDTPEVDL